MTLKETLAKLESLGSEKMRLQHKKAGASDHQYGVKMGDIRKVAQSIKSDHELALELWDTGIIDAQFLAILIMKPKKVSKDDIKELIRSVQFVNVVDWLYSYIIKAHPDKEALRLEWMKSKDPVAARLGWSLTSGRVAREPEGLDIEALLDRIEKEMPKAAPQVQWTMNSTLAQIGICMPGYRERALSIGEKLGIYRDYPVSKGCTSPFAPIWINEMVRRNNQG